MIIATVILLFGTYIISAGGGFSGTITEIKKASNVEELEMIWKKNESVLSEQKRLELSQQIKKQLIKLHLKHNDILKAKKWLPKNKEAFNFVIVPDLSSRINNTMDKNKRQFMRDTTIISSIYDLLLKKMLDRNYGYNHRIVVTLTDENQGCKTNKNLVIEFLDGKASHFNELKQRKKQFMANISEMYQCAQTIPIGSAGADYVAYFDNQSSGLEAQLKTADLYNDYKNIVFVITDGYLEATMPNGSYKNYTPLTQNSEIPLPENNVLLENTKLFLLEFNEQSDGKIPPTRNAYFKILRSQWITYAQNMGALISNKYVFDNQSNVKTMEHSIDYLLNE